MRILQVIAIFQRAAGTSVFCASVARELAALGHEVRIAVPDVTAEDLYPTEVPLIAISTALAETWDVVHIHGVWLPVLTRVQRWATAKGIRLVWSPHGMLQTRALMMKWPKKLAALALYQYASLRRADVIHVCSEREAANVRRLRLGCPLVTIPLGVETSLNEAELRQIKTRPAVKRTILYVGRINRGKGLVNLLKAWKKIVDDCPELANSWRIVIAGLDEENHRSELSALCDQLHIASRVTFPGPVYGDAKDRLYAEADLCVLPSLSENFGSVVIEALLAETPVIATNATPWQALPQVGCGWCVDVGVSPLATAFATAVALSCHERERMGRIGRTWAMSHFSWPKVAQAVEKVYCGEVFV